VPTTCTTSSARTKQRTLTKATRKKGRAPKAAESEAKADAESAEDAAGERPIWQRHLDLARAAGFMLRTKGEGWKLFCARLTVPPWAAWEGLPGLDRLQHALQLAEKDAFGNEGFLRWLNVIRPAGEPERAEVPLTVEGMAAAAEELFRQSIQWWGG
jgi:hypothetical protein